MSNSLLPPFLFSLFKLLAKNCKFVDNGYCCADPEISSE